MKNITEIKDMNLSLRSSGKLSYDNMMMIFKQNQIEKIVSENERILKYYESAQFSKIHLRF